eukprot:824494-Pleurochrysis_carterae.AAC.2
MPPPKISEESNRYGRFGTYAAPGRAHLISVRRVAEVSHVGSAARIQRGGANLAIVTFGCGAVLEPPEEVCAIRVEHCVLDARSEVDRFGAHATGRRVLEDRAHLADVHRQRLVVVDREAQERAAQPAR